MSKRTRIKNAPVLKSWDEVDLTLKEITECKLAKEAIENEAKKKCSDIQLEAKLQYEPLDARIEILGRHIKDFVEAHRTELDGKSKQLTFGVTGFRLSTSLVFRKAEQVLKALRSFGMTDCIKPGKDTVNKEVLKQYPEADIIKVGAVLQTEDTFFYDLKVNKGGA